jgi:hypothetical protein
VPFLKWGMTTDAFCGGADRLTSQLWEALALEPTCEEYVRLLHIKLLIWNIRDLPEEEWVRMQLALGERGRLHLQEPALRRMGL